MTVCIVGAGFSGIAAAISLRRAGVTDLVILERGASVGGTWRDNTYPGCACDVQSRLYELGVAPWTEWSRKFAPQGEIRAYLERVVEIFNLTPYLRLGTELLEARWVGDQWCITTSGGELVADSLICATGGLVEPEIPAIPGRVDFTGPQLHTARWDDSVEIDDKRIVVIGTGASAIQVVPAIAPFAEHVTVMQRTAPWILPRRDRAIAEWYQHLLSALPPLQQATRALTSAAREASLLSFTRGGRLRDLGSRTALKHLHAQVSDPDLRRRLTPSYEMGCKRVLLSDDYYPTLMRPDVDLAPAAAQITADSVIDSEGVSHPADVIVWATGFKVLEPPIAPRVVGTDGRTLAQVWADGRMSAYRGTSVAGFPNLYLLMGPNTALGHSSVVLMSEAQVAYLTPAVASGLIFDVRPEEQARFVAQMDEGLAGTVWQQGGCRSWYQDGQGRNIALWPRSTRSFSRYMRRFDPKAYTVRKARSNDHATT